MSKSNEPVKRFRIGFVTASIWRNESNGNPFYNTVLTRSYKDDDGNYQDTDQLNAGDLLNAAKVLQRAEEFISAQ